MMTQMTLGISVDIANQYGDDDKCVFCGGTHKENKKKDKIKPTGWKRKKIAGVGGNQSSYKKSLYPGNSSPPTQYTSEGHHCVAFSSFIRDARTTPRDYIAPLNHYLKEKKHDPNNPNNTIDLPGRKAKGDSDQDAQFKNFEKAVTANPSKPMQLHIGGHKSDLMMASDTLVRDIYNLMKRPDECSEDIEEWKNSLIENIQEAEDEAFDKTASVTYPFICHPGPLSKAVSHVKSKHGIDIVYPSLQNW